MRPTFPMQCDYCFKEITPTTQCTNQGCKRWRLCVPERDPLLVERQKTHGDFRSNAAISQRIKNIVKENTTERAQTLSDVHKEALDMIALKISRILSGQATVKDHWDDIAGYAKLGSEACE